MSKQSLKTQIKLFLNSDKKATVKLQELIVATREHAKQHGDLTLLSLLVTGLRDNRSRNLQAITSYILEYTKGIHWVKDKNSEGYKVIKDQQIELLDLPCSWMDSKKNIQVIADVDVITRCKSLVTTLTTALNEGKIKDGQEDKARDTIESLKAIFA